MEYYKNLSQDSGVTRYHFNEKSIIIEFQDGATYLYDFQQPGKKDVEHMKELALAGRGLSTYISTHVRKNFARKLK